MVIRSLRARVAVVVGVITFLLLAGTGAAYGYWTTNSASTSASATAATLSVTVTGDLTTTYAFTGTGSGTTTPAGASIITREAVITNPGTSTINLATQLTATRSASSTLAAADVAFWMWLKTTTCTGTSGTQTTLATPVSITGGTIAPGATQSVCIATRLNTTVAANTGKTLTITLDALGTHTSGWSATAAVASTQTVYSVAKPVAVCNDNDGNGGYGLTLTYTVPSGQTYDVYKSSDNGATYQLLQANAPSGQLYTATNLGGGTVVGTGVEFLRVTANGQYGVTTVGTPIPIKYVSVIITNTVRCNPEGTY